jgi:hypothetical protein
MRSILDFRPVDEKVVATCGAEPSLREMVYQYYQRRFDEDRATSLASDYCKQITEELIKRYG